MAYISERLDAMSEQLHRIEDMICEIWDLLGRAAERPGEERADGTAR